MLVFINSHTSQSWASEEHILSKKNVDVNPPKSEWVSARDGADVWAVPGGWQELRQEERSVAQPRQLLGLAHPLPRWSPAAGSPNPGTRTALCIGWTVLSWHERNRWEPQHVSNSFRTILVHWCYGREKSSSSLWRLSIQPLLGVECGSRFWDALEEKSALCLQILVDYGTHWEELILFFLGTWWKKSFKVVRVAEKK